MTIKCPCCGSLVNKNVLVVTEPSVTTSKGYLSLTKGEAAAVSSAQQERKPTSNDKVLISGIRDNLFSLGIEIYARTNRGYAMRVLDDEADKKPVSSPTFLSQPRYGR